MKQLLRRYSLLDTARIFIWPKFVSIFLLFVIDNTDLSAILMITAFTVDLTTVMTSPATASFCSESLQWFSDNKLKGNTDKCHLFLTRNSERRQMGKRSQELPYIWTMGSGSSYWMHFSMLILTHFFSMHPFSTSWKHQITLWFSAVFSA